MAKPVALLKSIKLTNFLSFGAQTDATPLEPLNVLIGPNGSGKSNFVEAFGMLKAAPSDLPKPIRGDGIRDWLWKGGGDGIEATIEVVTTDGRISGAPKDMGIRYRVTFGEQGQRFTLFDEKIENERPQKGRPQTYFYYAYQRGRPVLNIKGKTATEERHLQHESIDPEQSILSQRRDPEQYPEVTTIGDQFSDICIFRDWSFGRMTPPRQHQKADMPNEVLLDDASNLGLVLNRLRRNPQVKSKLLEELSSLYPEVRDFDVSIEAGSVQVFFTEGNFIIPATRLSDGTLRYLCLLAILCHPAPGPLVCIEEPELGLHPDVLPSLAKLLVDASTRTQLVVTTHSDILVDALSDRPECIIVCEKIDGATVLRRLEREKLAPWLAKYRLGNLWTRGEIGGTRW